MSIKRMKFTMFITAVFMFLAQFIFSAEEKFAVKVHSIKAGKGLYHVVADNYAPFPQQVNVDFDQMENLAPSVKIPFYAKVEANEKGHYLFDVQQITKGKYSYHLNYLFFMGDPDKAIMDKSYLYTLPFKKGDKHNVGQGNNGTFSHTETDKYAYDFDMKEGTAICAARDGIVSEVKDVGSIGGNDERFMKDGNHIVIYHSDGTLAIYSHLKNGGIAVKLGDSVKAGDVIGYSGNTGYTSGPHLHFAVLKSVKLGYESIAVRFLKEGELKEGVVYMRE